MPHYGSQFFRPSKRSRKPSVASEAPPHRPLEPFNGTSPAGSRSSAGDAMDVDVGKLVSEAIRQTEAAMKNIAFPSLAESPSSPQLHPIDTDQGRARKRSRTTALLTPPSPKRSPAPLSTPPTSDSSNHHAKRQRTVATPSPVFTYPAPTTPEFVQKEVVQAPSSTPYLSTAHRNIPTEPYQGPDSHKPAISSRTSTRRSGSSLLLRRKKPSAGEIQTLIFLYRSLVYGLRYSHSPSPTSFFNLYAFPEPSETLPEDPATHGFIYDTALARRLRTYLLYLGVDRGILEVDVQSVQEEVAQHGSTDLASLDTEDSSFAHPYLYLFNNCSVLAYPQLVAMLTMRHTSNTSSKGRRSHLPRRPRSKIPSGLRSSFVCDSD